MLKKHIIYNAKKVGIGEECLKQSVFAMVKSLDGRETFGSNKMKNTAIKSCPRDEAGFKSGEGYYLCKDICNQEAHAEYLAVKRAKRKNIDLNGATMYLVGHTYCCDKCTKMMRDNGVKNVYYVESNRLEEL